MHDITGGGGPHSGQPIVSAGAPLKRANGALVMVHGRGGSAVDMLGLAAAVAPPDIACLAPQAAGHTWYPRRFTEPLVSNEPYLGSALSVLAALVDRLISDGLRPEQIALLGFSQGACLALEFTRHQEQRLGAVIGLSGGLIGETVATPAAGARPLEGMPVLLGCSERDPHIPLGRVHETDAIMRALGADVTTRIYPGSGHCINEDEISLTRRILTRVIGVASQVV